MAGLETPYKANPTPPHKQIRYESSDSTAIFVRRLYLRFSRRYRAGAARGLAFWLKRESGGTVVLAILIILRSSAARV